MLLSPLSCLLSPVSCLLSPILRGQTLEGEEEVARLEAAVQSKRMVLSAISEENLQNQMEEEDLLKKTSDRSVLSPSLQIHAFCSLPDLVAW